MQILRDGSSLILSFAGQSGSIRVDNVDDVYGGGLERVVFGDATVWTQLQLRAAYLALPATNGNDTIAGFVGSDILSGGLGDDTLSGREGTDTYLYNIGDGHDRIVETPSYDSTTFDRLVFGAGLTPGQLQISREGSSLTLSFTGHSGSVRIDNMDDAYGGGIEQIVFGDSTVWSQQQLRAAYLAQSATSGNDTIAGFVGVDDFAGGLGDDVLSGGNGADTYLYNGGDGHDRIVEIPSYDATVDRLVIGTGLVSSDLVVTGDAGDLVLSFAGHAGSMRIDDGANAYGTGIEQFVFGDGETSTRADVLDIADAGFARTAEPDGPLGPLTYWNGVMAHTLSWDAY